MKDKRIVDWYRFLEKIPAEKLEYYEDLAEKLECPECGCMEADSPIGPTLKCRKCGYQSHWSYFSPPEIQALVNDAEDEKIMLDAFE